MGKYLEQFQGVIRSKQIQQVLAHLNKQKESGQIQSLADFNNRLSSLIKDLQGEVLKPSLKVLPGNPGGIISSQRHNRMLHQVDDDLTSAFLEVEQISEVQESHTALIKDLVLKNLRAGIEELESKVSLFEYLYNDTQGFDTAIFCTFREAQDSRQPRVQQSKTRSPTVKSISSTPLRAKSPIKKNPTSTRNNTSILFKDPKQGDYLKAEYDAEIDLIGERLTLPSQKKDYYSISQASQLFDDGFPQSIQISSIEESSISNITDGQTGTYWLQTVHVPDKLSSLQFQIELDLGLTREVGFIEIEPVCERPLILESIYYYPSNGILTLWQTVDLSITSPVVVFLSQVTTNKLVLVFTDENCVPSSFLFYPEYKKGEKTFDSEYPLGDDPRINPDLIEVINEEEPDFAEVIKDTSFSNIGTVSQTSSINPELSSNLGMSAVVTKLESTPTKYEKESPTRA